MLQQSRVDGGVGIHLIQMVGRTRNLACQPNRCSALLLQHGLDPVPDMYVPDLRHKKSVEFVPCLKPGLPRPHSLTSHSTPYKTAFHKLILENESLIGTVVVSGFQGQL